jgi:2-polyprenyl-6-methoxyphenol hydroxylase-like FAD-dependent oxidoreductase
MHSTPYDAIVVGARCAGSPTAMLLARKGYRVLLVDKATFPSDTMSSHIVHPPGVAALKRWNLLQRLQRTGCPPMKQYAFDVGPFSIAASLRPLHGTAHALCPRRTVLDKVLVEAAVEAGAELREGFIVDEVLIEGGTVSGIRGRGKLEGNAVVEHARVVIGADGMRSRVARAVQAPQYHERPTISAGHYAYWSGLPTERFEAHLRPRRAFAIAPTHDGLTVSVMAWPPSDYEASRGDIGGQLMRAVALVPGLDERMRGAQRESRFIGTGELPNFFRKPYGPGWVLVGDAGYHKDPITAQGISDAFRDAEAMANALDDVFTGRATFDAALAEYQRVRDAAALPMFDFTCQFASLEEPPPAQMQQLLAAIHGNDEAMSGFVSTVAGVVSPAEFFAPENVARIMAEAGAQQEARR